MRPKPLNALKVLLSHEIVYISVKKKDCTQTLETATKRILSKYIVIIIQRVTGNRKLKHLTI